jgi:hypothetical protein
VLAILSETPFVSRRIWARRAIILAFFARMQTRAFGALPYFTSLCGVCLRQRLQNFLNSSRSVVVFRFLVVE